MLTELNEKFNKRYSSIVADLNKFVNETPLIELEGDYGYQVPSVLIEGDGSTLVSGSQPVQLNAPAKVSVVMNKVSAVMPILRVAIPLSEIEAAMSNNSYFNYLFDSIVDNLLKQYTQKFGAYDKLRFGEYYAKFQPLTTTTINELDYIELRIGGKYAAR